VSAEWADNDWSDEQARAFGSLLAETRDMARRSQRRLAELSGVSHTTIARLERGQIGSRGRIIRPTPISLSKLAQGLALDKAGAVNAAVRSEIYSRFMDACGYGQTGYPEPSPLALVPDPLREAPVIHVRFKGADPDRPDVAIEVEVTGTDPVECSRLARDAFLAAIRNPNE
jgi:transcriptional regulator with XRE-family HTH domain